jgi:hypothetical protein
MARRLESERKPMLATLADLLTPVSCSEFLEVFRARKRLHIPAADPTRAERLFSWQEIDRLLSGHGLDENVSIMRDGVHVPPQFYTSSDGKQLKMSNEGKQLKSRAFHDLLCQGVSVVINGVHRSIPHIGQLAAAIEREMGIQTQVNAYLSFSKGGAFKPHFDVHDVLVIQVHGAKQWRVWNAEVPHPIEMADREKVSAIAAPDQEIGLAAGDVLFIPRGEPHSAAVSAGRSVHLSIGLFSQTGIDFLKYLRRQAVKDPLLRMDLPRHSSHEESDAHEAALKRRLHELIDTASVSQFLEEGDLTRLPAWQATVTADLPQLDDIVRPTLRRRISLPDVAPDRGPQSVTIGGELQRLSPASIDILRWLFDHDPATLRTLQAGLAPEYGSDSIEAAVRELLRLGFLIANRGG